MQVRGGKLSECGKHVSRVDRPLLRMRHVSRLDRPLLRMRQHRKRQGVISVPEGFVCERGSEEEVSHFSPAKCGANV